VSLQSIGQFPAYRPRRLRQSAALRQLVAETHLTASQLVLPLFVRAGRKLRAPSPPCRACSSFRPMNFCARPFARTRSGFPAVLLFGIPDKKDARASGAYAKNGIVQQAVRLLKNELPSLLVITDVCLCEYMEHGHCGIVGTERRTPVRREGKHAVPEAGAPVKILNDPTLKLLARAAASHAEAGADIVAPSDMMDGRVRAIRTELDRTGFADTPIMSYAAKFASAFYGPFREAAESAPKFGDRRSYQMNPANANEALREVALDIQEGADIVMVKPALVCLDLIYRVKTEFGHPTAAYAVSGEHAMIKAAAANAGLTSAR